MTLNIDGGHREPFIVRWREYAAPGSHDEALVCLGDFLGAYAEVTSVDLVEVSAPDSVSICPCCLVQTELFVTGSFTISAMACFLSAAARAD